MKKKKKSEKIKKNNKKFEKSEKLKKNWNLKTKTSEKEIN